MGYKHTESTKEKIRLANCGKTMSELSRIKMSVSAIKKFQKNKMSIETRTRMSNSRKNKTPWNKGVNTSEEVKQKISNSLLSRTSPMKDRTHSSKTKEQMSISRLGEKNGNSIITAELAIKIVELFNKEGLSQRKIATMLNISRGCVCAVLKGRTWQHITKIKNMEK